MFSLEKIANNQVANHFKNMINVDTDFSVDNSLLARLKIDPYLFMLRLRPYCVQVFSELVKKNLVFDNADPAKRMSDANFECFKMFEKTGLTDVMTHEMHLQIDHLIIIGVYDVVIVDENTIEHAFDVIRKLNNFMPEIKFPSVYELARSNIISIDARIERHLLNEDRQIQEKNAPKRMKAPRNKNIARKRK